MGHRENVAAQKYVAQGLKTNSRATSLAAGGTFFLIFSRSSGLVLFAELDFFFADFFVDLFAGELRVGIRWSLRSS
jgi:hypothetical protein